MAHSAGVNPARSTILLEAARPISDPRRTAGGGEGGREKSEGGREGGRQAGIGNERPTRTSAWPFVTSERERARARARESEREQERARESKRERESKRAIARE